MPSDAVLYQASALCLTYPDEDLRERLPLVREAAPQLRVFVDHAADARGIVVDPFGNVFVEAK